MGYDISGVLGADVTQGATAIGGAAMDRYLGPARVEAAEGRRLRVRIGDDGDAVWAVLAMPFAYDAAEGDTVLVIGQGGGVYVIGVIEGQGDTSLSVGGDLTLRAPNGTVTVEGGKGVRLLGGTVDVVGRAVSVTAETVAERCRSAARWVADLFELHAGQTRVAVESVHTVQARNIVTLASDAVKIDGDQVHLG